jgi:anti-sigma factor RsiW
VSTHPESFRFQELLDGELPAAEALELRQHVAGCESCARELALYRQLYHSLERLPEFDPGPAFTARVMERVLPSRVRRRWLRALGFGYATVSAGIVAASVVFATQPATRALIETLSAVASRRLARAMVFALNALSFSALSLAGGEQWLAAAGRRVAPIGRALGALFSQTDVLVPLMVAGAACVAVLWWMRPRGAEARKGMRHVGVLGF